MRLHLVALPHTRIESDFHLCAHTSKILRFCKMMGKRHEIFLYAPQGRAVEGATLVPCLTELERETIFGVYNSFKTPVWPTDDQTSGFNQNVIRELATRREPRDLVLLFAGLSHHAIAKAFPSALCIEPGVGYEGIFTSYCAFESYAWQHYLYGKNGILDGRYYDRVIPIAFDPNEFPCLSDGNGQYLAFLGRRIARKGLSAAADIARACGLPLWIAGPDELTVVGDVKYLGPLNIDERARFLAGAKALIFATTYIEPFGATMVESMLAGTPVIGLDWGAPSEVIDFGVTGFRFRTLLEAVEAVKMVEQLNPATIRARAIQRFSMEAVAPQYDSWFLNLQTLWDRGWYTI